jgi:SAM-dependent methyltransferase
MQDSKADLLTGIAAYYSDALARHGPTARGVDWNGEASQTLRFRQLCRIIADDVGFSLNDLGCGYGGLFEFLAGLYPVSAYLGVDISGQMIEAARQRHRDDTRARFIEASRPDGVADYGMASGIFNVRLDVSDERWAGHLEATLDMLDRTSRRGFAFNCLTKYSDEGRKRDHLYYADPCRLFDLCKCRYSRQVALLHDYGIYEFTILVRKP